MALQSGPGSLLEAFSSFLVSETRYVREEASPRHQPVAAPVSDAARPEDPAKRGVYPAREADSRGWTNRR